MLDIEEACEPSDIIWENRYFTPSQRRFKRLVVLIIIILMLTVSAAIIFTFTNISLKLKFRYPVVDCNDIDKEFGVSKDGMTATRATEYQDEALQEYNANADFEKQGKTT